METYSNIRIKTNNASNERKKYIKTIMIRTLLLTIPTGMNTRGEEKRKVKGRKTRRKRGKGKGENGGGRREEQEELEKKQVGKLQRRRRTK